MASSPSFDATLASIRRLFTTAERKVLDSSTSKAIATATETQLKAVLEQARILRDKWRDLLKTQARKTKRTVKRGGPYPATGEAPANDRSRQKSGLLADAVKRLEARLSDLAGGQATAAPPAHPVVRRPVAKRAAKKPIVGSKAARVARTVSKKARRAGALKTLESVAVQGLKTSAATQRKSTAALKADRLKLKGITTRRAGHSQARVGRAQARRDGRNAAR